MAPHQGHTVPRISKKIKMDFFRKGSLCFDISIVCLMILLKPLFCPKYEFIHYFGHCHTRRDGAPRRPYCFDISTKSLNPQLLESIGSLFEDLLYFRWILYKHCFTRKSSSSLFSTTSINFWQKVCIVEMSHYCL